MTPGTFEPLERCGSGLRKWCLCCLPGKQKYSYISHCLACGDWIMTRHRIRARCLFCQAERCAMSPKTFSRFYRCAQWRNIRIVVFNTKGRKCSYCGKFANTVDHQIPLRRGGTNLLENLEPVCGVCNRKKQSKTHAEFSQELKNALAPTQNRPVQKYRFYPQTKTPNCV